MKNIQRTFIAVELSSSVRQDLAKVQDLLKDAKADIRWVQLHNIHLTIRFLGNISTKRIKRIKTLLPQALTAAKAFEVAIDHLGIFPSLKYPKVVWAGIGKGGELLNNLAGAVENAVNHAGLPKKKEPFAAHITLARIRSGLNVLPFTAAVTKYKFVVPVTETVSSVTLFQSTLTAQGPAYSSLLSLALNRVSDKS